MVVFEFIKRDEEVSELKEIKATYKQHCYVARRAQLSHAIARKDAVVIVVATSMVSNAMQDADVQVA